MATWEVLDAVTGVFQSQELTRSLETGVKVGCINRNPLSSPALRGKVGAFNAEYGKCAKIIATLTFNESSQCPATVLRTFHRLTSFTFPRDLMRLGGIIIPILLMRKLRHRVG